MIDSDTGTGGSDVIKYLGRFKGELFFPAGQGIEPVGSGGLYPLLGGQEYHRTEAQVLAKPSTTPDLLGAEGETNNECN
jgi:hypothetical protein